MFCQSLKFLTKQNMALTLSRVAEIRGWVGGVPGERGGYTVFEVPLKTVALSRCSFKAPSREATKSTSLQNIPGLLELSLSHHGIKMAVATSVPFAFFREMF